MSHIVSCCVLLCLFLLFLFSLYACTRYSSFVCCLLSVFCCLLSFEYTCFIYSFTVLRCRSSLSVFVVGLRRRSSFDDPIPVMAFGVASIQPNPLMLLSWKLLSHIHIGFVLILVLFLDFSFLFISLFLM